MFLVILRKHGVKVSHVIQVPKVHTLDLPQRNLQLVPRESNSKKLYEEVIEYKLYVKDLIDVVFVSLSSILIALPRRPANPEQPRSRYQPYPPRLLAQYLEPKWLRMPHPSLHVSRIPFNPFLMNNSLGRKHVRGIPFNQSPKGGSSRLFSWLYLVRGFL